MSSLEHKILCLTLKEMGGGRCMKVKVKSLSRVRLFATPWTVAYQAPPSVGFSWVAVSFSRRSSLPRDRTQVSCIVGRCFNLWATWWVKKVWKEKEHELIGLSFFPLLFAIIFEGSNQINNEAAWVRKNMIEFLAGLCSSECHCLLSACEASSGLKKSVAFRGCLCLCLP